MGSAKSEPLKHEPTEVLNANLSCCASWTAVPTCPAWSGLIRVHYNTHHRPWAEAGQRPAWSSLLLWLITHAQKQAWWADTIGQTHAGLWNVSTVLCLPWVLHRSHITNNVSRALYDADFNKFSSVSLSDLHSIESREGNLPFQRHSCLVHLKPLQPSKEDSY